MMTLSKRIQAAGLAAGLMLIAALPQAGWADTAEEINLRVDEALERFRNEIQGGDRFLEVAKGVLVLPNVIKGGFVFGAEYGEGALRIGGKTVEYYSTAAGSFGLQAGLQSKAVFLVFMQQEALDSFRNSSGWRAGVDGSINLIKVGAGGAIDTTNIKDPIIGFVMTNAGLMANITLEGSKYTKIVR